MRHEIDIGGRHKMAFDDGVLDVVYDGEVEEQHARVLMRAAADWSTGAHTVWCSDIKNLTNYSAQARKVMSSGEVGNITSQMTSHLFISGATIKSKAVLALVITASKLLGNIRYETTYFDHHDEALRAAKAKFVELERAGLAKLPDRARSAAGS